MVTSQAAAARRAADEVAAAAGVDVRPLEDLSDLRTVHALYRQIWQSDSSDAPVNLEQLRALTHAGNYVSGAYRAGELVGACVGFFAAPPGEVLHSHVAGVAASARASDVGFALKLHQRAWALALGLREITWTFDPLIRRNAYFNLVKLAGRPREYLVDFYGDLADAVNAGQGSDRLLVAWELASPEVTAASERHRQPERRHQEHQEQQPDRRWDPTTVSPALSVSAGGRPSPARATGSTVCVPVPEDIEDIRRRDPDLARRWRSAVRDTLGGLMHGGARVVGFDRAAGYVVEQWSPRKLAQDGQV